MMTDNVYYRPILPLLIAMMAGISLGAIHPGYGVIAWLVICFCMIIVAGVLFFPAVKFGSVPISSQALATSSALVLFLGLGYLAILHWMAPVFPDNHITHFSDNQYRQISGTIVSNPIIHPHGTKFILAARSLTLAGRFFPVTGKARVTVGGQAPDLSVGEDISFAGKLRPLHNFNNPGGFDYRGYMAAQQIWCSTYTRGKNILRVGTTPISKYGHFPCTVA